MVPEPKQEPACLGVTSTGSALVALVGLTRIDYVLDLRVPSTDLVTRTVYLGLPLVAKIE